MSCEDSIMWARTKSAGDPVLDVPPGVTRCSDQGPHRAATVVPVAVADAPATGGEPHGPRLGIPPTGSAHLQSRMVEDPRPGLYVAEPRHPSRAGLGSGSAGRGTLAGS